MKRLSSTGSAFVVLRAVAGLLLCSAGVLFAFFASGLMKTAGPQNVRRGGGGAPLSNSPAEQRPSAVQNDAEGAAYNSPQNDLRPVAAVRSGELRHTKPIHPSKAPK